MLKKGTVECGFWSFEEKKAFFQKKKKRSAVARKLGRISEVNRF